MNDIQLSKRLSRLGYTVDEVPCLSYHVRNRAGLRYTAMDKNALYLWAERQESKQAADKPQDTPALYDPEIIASLLSMLEKPMQDALDELVSLNQQDSFTSEDIHYACCLWASTCHGFAFRLTALIFQSGMAQKYPVLTDITHALLRLAQQTSEHYLTDRHYFALAYDAWIGDFCALLLKLDIIMKDETLKDEDGVHIQILAEIITLMQVFLLEIVKLRTSSWE